MAFFPCNFPRPNETSFTPLFRLLDDFDNHSRQSGRNYSVRRQAVPHWQPKFDIRETSEAYELYGELPGINREDVHLEFSDPQTLVIRGRNERTYTAGSSPSAKIEEAPATPATPTAATETETETEERRGSHQATVENEDEAMEHESGYEVVANDDEKRAEKDKATQKPADKAKYWLTERSIGEFFRSFNFPSRIEQDTVTASFKNGILSVTIHKAKKHEIRRINID